MFRQRSYLVVFTPSPKHGLVTQSGLLALGKKAELRDSSSKIEITITSFFQLLISKTYIDLNKEKQKVILISERYFWKKSKLLFQQALLIYAQRHLGKMAAFPQFFSRSPTD